MKEAPPLRLTNSFALFEEAKRLVPGGALYTNKPTDFVPGEYPIFFESGQGGRITDADGNEFVDFLCGYGPIILGHREQEVDTEVMRQLTGKGLCLAFSQPCQNQLAARLRELVPCCEKSVFFKSGSDATTAAIRVARAHTGRVKVMRCGFHGWHDWCVEIKGGVPLKLYEDVYDFAYNNLDELAELMEKHGRETAAIIMTPIGHDMLRPVQEPKPGFLQGVRQLADHYGAVLVFDEIRTNFRLHLGGAQAYYGVTPDLAALGKSLANGYAISVLVGNAAIMEPAAEETFISSTFAPNSDGIVAALATLRILERDRVLESIWSKGERFMAGIRNLLDRYPVGAVLSGPPPMFCLTFRREKNSLHGAKRDYFYTQLIRRGVFMSPHHHGNLCHRHSEEDLALALEAMEKSLACLYDKFGAIPERRD